MTQARLRRAVRERIAEKQRAEARQRQLSAIERDLAAIERIMNTALMLTIAWRQGRISEARCRAMLERLEQRLFARDGL